MARRVLGHSDPGLVGAAVGILGDHGGLEDLGRLLSPQLRRKVRTRGLRAAASVIRRADKGSAQEQAMARMSGVLVKACSVTLIFVRGKQLCLCSHPSETSRPSLLGSLSANRNGCFLIGECTQCRKEIRSRANEVDAPAKENQREAQLKDLESRIEELEDQMRAWNDKH